MPPKSTKPKRQYKKKMPKQTFDKRVMSVIKHSAESKSRVVTLNTNSNIPGNGLALGGVGGLLLQNVLNLVNLGQGLTQGLRIGNKVQNCRLAVRGFVESKEWDAVTNPSLLPYELHMLVYKAKDDPSNIPTSIVQAPNDVNVPIDGGIMTSIYPFNKDRYIIKKHKVFRLNSGPVSQTASSTFINPSYNSSKEAWFRRFKVNIPISSTLKFTDNSNVPTNDWVAIGFYFILGDGTVTTNAIIKAQVSMDVVLSFDDF